MQWTVLLEAEAADGEPDLDVGDRRISRLSVMLAHVHDGAASGGSRRWTARVMVRAGRAALNAEQAAVTGRSLILLAARQVGLPEWRVAKVEAEPRNANDL